MKKYILAIAPVIALLSFTSAAMAQKISLNALSNYLNSLTTVQSEFTQIDPSGTISSGTVYIQRPNRVRFDYKGSNQLVLASGGQVAVFDAKSNQGPQIYPLNKTPLSIILAPNINLRTTGMVTGHSERKNTTVVRAQDPANPQYGNIEMVFTSPTELRQWIVTDDTGKKTTVILGQLHKGVKFKPSTFAIQSEINRRK